jgi:hypothetical protein
VTKFKRWCDTSTLRSVRKTFGESIGRQCKLATCRRTKERKKGMSPTRLRWTAYPCPKISSSERAVLISSRRMLN